MTSQGWHNDSHKHSLAARGIATKPKKNNSQKAKVNKEIKELLESENHGAMASYLMTNRGKLGRSGIYSRRYGQLGERLAELVVEDDAQAHDYFNSPADFTDPRFNIEVKTMNPKTMETPVQPKARAKKIDASTATGKPWRMILLSVQGDRIDVYEHDPTFDFYVKSDKAYPLALEESRYMGYIDRSGDFIEVDT
jgi:hypothetical protein